MTAKPTDRGSVVRRALGYAWFLGWMLVLYAFYVPWRSLGGLEGERLRWLEGFVLFTGLLIGYVFGRLARRATVVGTGRTHASFLRFLLYPPAILTAISLAVLGWNGQSGEIGVVSTAFLAYWAGLDLAFGALPMMEGRDYAFERALAPDPERPKLETDRGAVAPWERI